jgi:ferric-dicitrate binding protein FerR (iron transport regulator)
MSRCAAFATGISLILPFTTMPVSAQGTLLGTARTAIGAVVITRADGVENRMQGPGAGIQLFELDTITTDSTSRGLLDLGDGVVVLLNNNTQVSLITRWEKSKGMTPIIRLAKGEVLVKTGGRAKAAEVETPVGTAVTSEGDVAVRVQERETMVTAIQGKAAFASAYGLCELRPATVSYVMPGKSCTSPTVADVSPTLAWSRPLLQP